MTIGAAACIEAPLPCQRFAPSGCGIVDGYDDDWTAGSLCTPHQSLGDRPVARRVELEPRWRFARRGDLLEGRVSEGWIHLQLLPCVGRLCDEHVATGMECVQAAHWIGEDGHRPRRLEELRAHVDLRGIDQ